MTLADQIARIIIAAAKEFEMPLSDIETFMSGPYAFKEMPEIQLAAKVRIYAAFAIRQETEIVPTNIGKCLGASDGLFGAYKAQRASGKLMIDPSVLERVASAGRGPVEVKAYVPPPPKPPRPEPPMRRPFTDPHKPRLLDELRRAVENTARMTPKE